MVVSDMSPGKPAPGYVVALTENPPPVPSSKVGASFSLVSLMGAKAANLARLASAGFAVPEGLVLTTEAHRAAWSPGASNAHSDAANLSIPADVENAISFIADHFGTATLAVRSSAVDEDTSTASYAGLYETTLGVRGEAQLREAILSCWASASANRVRSYSAGWSAGAPIAVLVQRQLAPDVAGVAFTADPVTGDRSVTLVSAVPGLGDRLVSGTVTPDQWRVAGETATPENATLQALTAEQAVTVALLARRIEAITGTPQDIEWAMDSERLVVLQARPITALPQTPRVDDLDGVWLKEQNRYAEPMTALGASVATVVVARGLSDVFATYGGVIERVECRSIGGEIYLRMVPIGGRESGLPPPWWVLGALTRTIPALRHRMNAARRNASPAALSQAAARWRGPQRAELRLKIEALQRVELASLDDDGLAEHLHKVRELLESAMAVHFRLTVPGVVPLYVFVRACRRLLGWGESRALGLLAGVSTATSEPARAVAPISEGLRQHQDALSSIREGKDIALILHSAAPELGRAFDQWKRLYASVCMSDDPGSTTLAERQDVLRELLLTDIVAIRDRFDAVQQARERLIAEARATLRQRGTRARSEFEAALSAAEDAYGLREDVAFWTGSQCGGLLRMAALEAGRRLAAEGCIDRAGDAVHLDVDSLIRAMRNKTPMHKAVTTAVAERAWARQHPGPAVLGGHVPTMPDLRGLPEPARTVNEAMQWVRSGSVEKSEPHNDESNVTVFEGLPGAGGTYSGPARLIRSEADFGVLREGDVLVATTTDPAWSVLFAIAGALVTQTGGVLSHAAIVAREYGIPAVLAVPEATSLFKDGDALKVDGSLGRVLRADRIVSAAKTSPPRIPTQQEKEKKS
ncbi:MAG: hypothetical protein KF692_11840 [Cryobacterium sp.]|nr:hypothetical protein [Cryobacterium sp.]